MAVLVGKAWMVCRLLGPNGAGKSTSINMVRPCACTCHAVQHTIDCHPATFNGILAWLVRDKGRARM